jgi:hypothetical protein
MNYQTLQKNQCGEVSWQLELSFAPLCLQNLLTRDPSYVRGNVWPFLLFGSLSRLRPSSFPLAFASHLRPLRLPVMPPRTPPPPALTIAYWRWRPRHPAIPPPTAAELLYDRRWESPKPSSFPEPQPWPVDVATIDNNPLTTVAVTPPPPHPPDPDPPPFLTFPLLLHLRTRYAPWPPRIQTHLALNIRKKEENGLSLPSTQGGTCSWEST